MKRCFAWAIALFAISASVIAANQITGYVQVNPPISPQPGSFNISSGTVGQFTDTGLTTGGCVQATIGGLLTTTGVNCGSGGGGGSGSGTINSAAQYSAPYYSIVSSNVVSGLAPGTSGYFYTTAGIGAAPFWSIPVSTVTVASLGALSSSTIIPSNQFSVGYYSVYLTSQIISGDGGFFTDGSGNLSAKSLFASSEITTPNLVINSLINVPLATDSFGNVVAGSTPPSGDVFLASTQTFTGGNTFTQPVIGTSGGNFLGKQAIDLTNFTVLKTSTTTSGSGNVTSAINASCSGSGGGGANCIGAFNSSSYSNTSGNAIGTYSSAVGIGNNSGIQILASGGVTNHAINILGGDIKQTLTNTILATDGNGIIISTTVTGGGSSSGSSVYPATATASFPFGFSASTVAINQINTGNVNAVTIVSTGTGIPLSVQAQGFVSNGYQNRKGIVTVGDDISTRPFSTEMVIVDSTTDSQAGGGLIEVWSDNPLHNDPKLWFHVAGHDSSPEIRDDANAPNWEMVNTSTDNAHGLGKFEPAAVAFQGVDLQVNNRAYDNSGFENLAYWHPLSKLDTQPGLYIEPQNVVADAAVITSSDTSGLNFFTLNAHTVGITGPQNPSASYVFGLPDTVGAAGEFWYNSGNRGGNFNARQIKHSGTDLVYSPTTGLTVSTITATSSATFSNITINGTCTGSGCGTGGGGGATNGTIVASAQNQVPVYSLAGSSTILTGSPFLLISTTTNKVTVSGANFAFDNTFSNGNAVIFSSLLNLNHQNIELLADGGVGVGIANSSFSAVGPYLLISSQGFAVQSSSGNGDKTYSGFAATGPVTQSVLWTFPTKDSVGAWQSDGSGHLSISPVSAGGTTTQYASQLVDCQVVRASASSLGIASSATVTNPCTISFGSQIYQFTSSSTLTLGSSTGTVRIYVSNSADGTGAGTLQAAWSSATGLTGSGINVQTTDSVFGGGVPLGLWNATVAGTWDATGTDDRAWLNSTKPLLGGSGMTVTETATSQTVSFNGQVVVPVTSAYGIIVSSSSNLSNPFLAVSTNGVTTLNGATQISSGSYLIAVSSSILAGSTTGFALDTFFNLKSSGSITSTLGVNASSMVITTSNLTMVVSSNGYTGSTGGSAPTFSGCGTTPTVTAGSNNMRGSVTMTSGLSSACTIIPATPVPQNYFCTISGGGAGTAVFFQQSGNLTAACDNATGLVTCGVGTFMIWNCSGTN